MRYSLEITSSMDKILRKLSGKDNKRFNILNSKIDEIRDNPYHNHKFLRKPLQGYARVHINSHFVLIFQVNHNKQSVVLYYFGHHDEVYQWRPEN